VVALMGFFVVRERRGVRRRVELAAVAPIRRKYFCRTYKDYCDVRRVMSGDVMLLRYGRLNCLAVMANASAAADPGGLSDG